MSDASHSFNLLLRQLEGWYADSVRARAYDAGGGTPAPGHSILLPNKYPGPDWRSLWAAAGNNFPEQLKVIRAIQEELYGLDHSPSGASPATGLHRGTHEWRLAVAKADGSLRAVARRFGVSHTEVRRLRLQHGGA